MLDKEGERARGAALHLLSETSSSPILAPYVKSRWPICRTLQGTFPFRTWRLSRPRNHSRKTEFPLFTHFLFAYDFRSLIHSHLSHQLGQYTKAVVYLSFRKLNSLGAFVHFSPPLSFLFFLLAGHFPWTVVSTQ